MRTAVVGWKMQEDVFIVLIGRCVDVPALRPQRVQAMIEVCDR